MAIEMDLLMTQTIALCSLITGITAVVMIIVQIVRKAKEPNDIQNVRITKCENEISEIKNALEGDSNRFDKLEEGNRITLQCLLALLSHGIDGNEIEGMRKAKESLQEYLISQ